MSRVVTDSAGDSHHFLRAGPALSLVTGGNRISSPLLLAGAPAVLVRAIFPCTPPHKGLEGVLPPPSPTSSPKAQAPWQRPRRQGGVCQRHLSLTSSITGHHGNTHDSTQEGLSLPSPPSVPPFIRASAGPKLETPVPPGSEKPNSLPAPSSRLIQTMASGVLGQPPAPHHIHTNFTPSEVQAPPLRYTRDWGMLPSHTPKSSRAQEKGILGVGTHAQACRHTTRLADGMALCILC